MQKHKLLVVGLLLTLAAGLDAPAAASDKETRQMMADIRMLQEQTQTLQNLLAAFAKSSNDALEAAIAKLNAHVDAKLQEQATATTQAMAGQKVLIDTITRDVGALVEKVNETNVRVGSVSLELTAVRTLVTQVNAVRSASDSDFGAPDNVTLAGNTAPSSAASASGESPQRILDGARLDYGYGRFPLAIEEFGTYIKKFPQSDQAADAQVLIGNCYLQSNEPEKAIEAYDLAIRNYPNKSAIPQAYWKKGVALLDLKRNDEAKAAFEYVVKNFPKSDEANLAATKLPQVPKQ